VISTSSSGRQMGGSCSKRDQGCKAGGQTTPSWNTPAVLVMEEHCTGCQHSTSFILNGPMQLFRGSQYAYVIVVSYWMNSTISSPSLSQKTTAINFLATDVCLNFLSLFGECVCAPTTLTAFWFQHSQM
jgi:hypothetical protein